MRTDDGESRFFTQPASRSYYFIFSTIFIFGDLGAAVVLLFRRLNSLPFPAATGLVAAMFALVGWWRFALHRHEEIRILIQGQEWPSPNSATASVLRASANLIYGGLFLTALAAGMLLLALVQVLKWGG
jgi:hypothetical protein